MKSAVTLVLTLVLAGGTGCEKEKKQKPAAKPPPTQETPDEPRPPAQPDEKPPTAGDKALAFMDTLAAAIEDNQEDCAKMDQAVQKVFDDNAEFVALVEKMRAADPETREDLEASEEHKTFKAERQPERSAVMKRIAAADKCIAKVPRLAENLKKLGKRVGK